VASEPLNVLIVEDEAIVAVELELAVEDAGSRVAGVAGDLKEAMEAAERQPIDIALVDINLRDGRTGVLIASRLAREHGVSVIFLTANADLVPPGFPDALGVYPKPYDPGAVVELIGYAAAVRGHKAPPRPPRRFRMADWLKARSGEA
jgi:CheY-like chemotaxis protein